MDNDDVTPNATGGMTIVVQTFFVPAAKNYCQTKPGP